jgi:hypothetical protein
MNKFIVTTISVLTLATSVYGHGDQVQITFNPATGRIETRSIVHTASLPTTITDLRRVYVMPFRTIIGGSGDGWYTRTNEETNAFGVPLYPTGPGIAYQYESQLPGTGWSFSGSGSLPNLQASNFSYQVTDGLKEWNSSGFVDPGVEQMQIFRGDGTTVPTIMSNTTDSGPFSALAMSSITSLSSNSHSSIGYRLLGDGTNFGLSGPAAGDDGVYLLSLSLQSTAAGVNPSDPFYYVMYKNVDQSVALAAAQGLGLDPSLIQVTPEPGSMGLLLGLATLAVTRKRHRA